MEKNMDKGKSCAALLTDLSKTLDCIVSNFLTAKLEAYGFSYKGVKVMHYYLTDRKCKTKINDSFSYFVDLLLGIPQGSILGPLYSKYSKCDLFFFVEEDNVTSYADNKAPYLSGKNVVTVLENIETKWKEVFNWFSMNHLASLLASLRSSHRRCSINKGFLRNFTKFTGKHLCQRLFLNKVAGLRLRTTAFEVSLILTSLNSY